MKPIKIAIILSPLILILLYLELLNIENYYQDRILVGEIMIKESNASVKSKTTELYKIHKEGIQIIRTKQILELLAISILLFLFISLIIYMRKSREHDNA